MKKRIGFFGGCFNPVTKAHVNLIKEVIKQENLEKVYFVPMGDLYVKKDLLPLQHRLKMLELAFEKEDQLEILNISNTNQKMCAIDTFQIIDEKFSEVDRFFIMGSDNYHQISQWKNADELLKKYHYIVLNREEGKMKQISSSLIREKIRRGETVEEFVPCQVLAYIEQMNLYK